MPLDFTVVIAVRQQFGDDEQDNLSDTYREGSTELHAPFVGAEKNYFFQCPSVDRSQFAMLLFQSHGVGRRQDLAINGQPVYGGIPVDLDSDIREFGTGTEAREVRRAYGRWNGNVMLIHPGVLQENNVLRIVAGQRSDGLEDFIVDNVVVVFKTRARGIVAQPPTRVPRARRRKPRVRRKRSR